VGGVNPEPDDAVLHARAFLSRVVDPGCIPVWDLVRREGAVAAAAAIRSERAPDDVLRATAARRASADPSADLDAAGHGGIRLLVPESADWPHFAMGALERTALARLGQYRAGQTTHSESGELVPPLALWARGPLDPATVGVRSVGIVGSRAATAYGEQVTTEFAYELARRDVVIVSGGAYGIDATAHRAALATGGQTVLVSAGGLDRPYPPGNAALFERVAAGGLLLSESPPGCAPQRHRFLTRNRLIAALSTGVLIVEAATRSGALNTAAHCTGLQRPLMAVPGPVTSAFSAGCHNLIRRDVRPALLVSSVDEVLAVVGGLGEGSGGPVGGTEDGSVTAEAARTPGLRARLDGLDRTARRVFEGLYARRFAHPDEIAARSGVGPLEVIRALPTLELAGLLEVGDEGYRVARER
jgi:DNA processing protein